MDTESPRIHGLEGAVRVFDICCTKALLGGGGKGPRECKNATAVEIDSIEYDRKRLDGERKLRQQEYDCLESAARSFMMRIPIEFLDGLAKIMQQKREAMDAMLDFDEQIAELERKAWALSKSNIGGKTQGNQSGRTAGQLRGADQEVSPPLSEKWLKN